MSSVISLNPAAKPLDLDRDRLVNLLYQMQLTRAFEETAFDQYSQGKVHGTMHLYVGEEAAAIGSIATKIGCTAETLRSILMIVPDARGSPTSVTLPLPSLTPLTV